MVVALGETARSPPISGSAIFTHFLRDFFFKFALSVFTIARMNYLGKHSETGTELFLHEKK